uniref:Uncharacterized protein n=1 Tax=Arundo donax TaxID=35708 RepID=A0A0A9DMK3_ARUDO
MICLHLRLLSTFSVGFVAMVLLSKFNIQAISINGSYLYIDMWIIWSANRDSSLLAKKKVFLLLVFLL